MLDKKADFDNLEFDIMYEDERVASIKIKDGKIVKVVKFTETMWKQPLCENVSLEHIIGFMRRRAVNPNRVDIAEILKALKIDKYNTMDVVRKTHGVCVSDDIWIRFKGENIKWSDVKAR